MRGCLSFLVFAAVLVGGLVWFALPPVADVLVAQAVGLALDGRIAVHVESSFPPSLLTLHADAVTLDGADVRPHGSGIEAGGMDLRLRDVDLLARSAASVSGTLTNVTIPAAASPTGFLVLPRIDLDGPAARIATTATVPGAAVHDLVSAAVQRATGVAPAEVALVAPDRVHVRLGTTSLDGRLAVDSGSLIAQLDRPAARVTLVDRSELLPLALQQAGVVDGDLLLTGTIEASALGLSTGGP